MVLLPAHMVLLPAHIVLISSHVMLLSVHMVQLPAHVVSTIIEGRAALGQPLRKQFPAHIPLRILISCINCSRFLRACIVH